MDLDGLLDGGNGNHMAYSPTATNNGNTNHYSAGAFGEPEAIRWVEAVRHGQWKAVNPWKAVALWGYILCVVGNAQCGYRLCVVWLVGFVLYGLQSCEMRMEWTCLHCMAVRLRLLLRWHRLSSVIDWFALHRSLSLSSFISLSLFLSFSLYLSIYAWIGIGIGIGNRVWKQQYEESLCQKDAEAAEAVKVLAKKASIATSFNTSVSQTLKDNAGTELSDWRKKHNEARLNKLKSNKYSSCIINPTNPTTLILFHWRSLQGSWRSLRSWTRRISAW